MVSDKLTMNDLKPEAKYATERWIVTSDPKYRKHYYTFFEARPGEGRPDSGSASSRKQLPTKSGRSPSKVAADKALLEAQQKELDMANWNTSYNISAFEATINTSPKKKVSSHGRVMLQLAQDVIKPSSLGKIKKMASECNEREIEDMTCLMRSLSIAAEQQRTAFSSEYFVQYVPKEPVPTSNSSVEDARSSSLTGPVTWAPPKMVVRHVPAPFMPPPTPRMARPAPKPQAQKGLLNWPGGGGSTSTYRTHYHKLGEVFPSVVSSQEMMSFSCGRTVPDSLVGDQFRNNPVLLPCELESRHILRQRHPSSNPSFHLLYKDGVVYTDAPGKHHVGDSSVYMQDFVHNTSVVKQSKPTLDPFGSSITITMSDRSFLGTTYQGTICQSAKMEYDRSLV